MGKMLGVAVGQFEENNEGGDAEAWQSTPSIQRSTQG